MGKISSEAPKKDTTATHFSHPHPLNLISYQTIPNLAPNSCSGCKLKPSGIIYSCTVCNYFLHKRCFEMPKTITHPFHKDHALCLLPEPAYAEGAYSCDACKEAGSGFSYHCKPCGIDLHILCAAMPLSLTTACHAHKLDLHFESPYANKAFRCDVCSAHGSNHWLYRCNLCGFDTHLKCATGAPPPVCNPLQRQSHTNFMASQYQRAGPVPPPHHVAATVPAAAPYPVMNNNAAVGVPNLAAYGVNRQQSDQLAQLQAMIQAIHNNNQPMTQGVLAGGAGGFGGGFSGTGSGAGLQQLTQLMSGLMNNSGFGGAGGIPGLNAFGGAGGGGGLDSLQSLLGGGDGGLDFLGGGGFDFLGGLL